MMDLFRVELTETSDGDGQQLLGVKGFPGEELARVPRVMPHGLASHAPKGSHGIGLALGGRRDEVVVLGLEQPASRPRNVPAGGAVLYDDKGNVIRLFGDEGVETETDTRPYTIRTGTFTVEADEIVLKMKTGDLVIRLRPNRIDLGAMEATQRVMTEGGPSNIIWGEIG